MRASRRFIALMLLVLFALPVASTAAPTSSAGVGTGLWAGLRRGDSRAYVYFVDHTGSQISDFPPEADDDSGVMACAALFVPTRLFIGSRYYFTYRQDEGCGRLTVTMDPLMGAANVKGSLRSYYTGSRISVDIRMLAKTQPLPYASVSRYVDDYVSVYPSLQRPDESARVGISFSAGSGIRREAGVSGTVKSSLVTLSRGTGSGYMFRGAGLSLHSYSWDE